MLNFKKLISTLLITIFLISSFSNNGVILFANPIDNPYENSIVDSTEDTEDDTIQSDYSQEIEPSDEAVDEIADNVYDRDKARIIIKYKTSDITLQKEVLSNVETEIKEARAFAGKSKLITKSDIPLNKVKEIDVIDKIYDLNIEVITIENSDNIDTAIELLEQDKNVEYAQPDYTFETLAVPTDPDLDLQWGLKNNGQTVNGQVGTKDIDINISPVWESDYEFKEVVVGVLDTGIDITHSDLPGKFVDGWDFANKDNSVFDVGDTAHGTQISGIIAANHNNEGIAGVAPNAKIMPLKFIQDGYGYTTDAIEAIKYAKDQGVKIINCSWGSDIYNPALKEVMEKNNDILFICAAGNNGSEKQIYPAAFDLPNIISVTAIDNTGNLWSRSNYGESVDIAAPGVDIYTTGLGNTYGYVIGTSMSAAYATGAAALYKGLHVNKNSVEIAEAVKDSAKFVEQLDTAVKSNGILDIQTMLNIDKNIDLLDYINKDPIPQELLDLLASGTFYSQTTQEQKDALLRYLFVRQDTMEDLELDGLTINDSIVKARIMQVMEISKAQMYTFVEACGSEVGAEFEASELDRYQHQFIWMNGSDMDVLTSLMIKGYSAYEVTRSKIAAMYLNVNVADIISKEPSLRDNSNLSTEDKKVLEQLSRYYCVNGTFLYDHMNKNQISVRELQMLMYKYQLQSGCFLYSENKALADSNDQVLSKEYPSAPFNFKNNINENINLNSGSVTYKENIINMPGPNGFNLDLTLQYNSNDANVDKVKGYINYYLNEYPVYTYFVTYCRVAYVNGTTRDTSKDEYSYATFRDDEYSQMRSSITQFEAGGDKNIGTPSSYTKYEHRASYQYIQTGVIYETVESRSNKVDAYQWEGNPLKRMGVGWRLNTTAVIIENNEKYLMFADGSTYKYQYDGKSNLKNYLLQDIKFEEVSYNPYPNAKYMLSYVNGVKEYFDGTGNILARIDRYNNTIKFEYKATSGTYLGELTVTDATGSITKFQYNQSLAVVTLPDNNQIKYYFEKSGNYHLLKRKVDQKNLETTFNYLQPKAKFNYFSDVSSGSSTETTANNLVEVVYPTGAKRQYSYEASNGNLSSNGRYVYYRLKERKDYDGTEYNKETYTFSSNNYTGYTTNYTSDELPASFNYSVTVKDLNNNSTLYSFNNKHLETSSSLTNGSLKSKKTYEYNAYKLPIKVTDYIYGTNTITKVDDYTYDIYGNLLTSKNDFGTTTYTYSTGSGTYNIILSKTYNKDSLTTIKELNELTTDKKSIQSNKIYDNNALQAQKDFSYDAYGNVIQLKEYTSSSGYITTNYTYYNKAFIKSQTISNITKSYTYDSMGRMLSSKDGKDYITKYEYDVLGRQTKITNPDGTTIKNNYDDTNNILTVTNENGVQTKYTYDRLGNIKSIQDIETGVTTSYDYDNLMRLTTETDPKQTKTVYVYDYLNRVKSKTVGSSLYSESYLYQDGLDANTSKVTKTINGETNAPSLVTAEYTDKYGNLVKQSRMNGTTEISDTFAYDYLGNRIQATNALNQITKYEYDFAGRVTKVTNPDNSIFQTAYDWLGRKISVTDPKNSVSKYTYNDLSQLTKEEIPFEGSYYTTKIYQYDKNGNVTRQNISNNKPGSAATSSRIEYQYNNRNWLVKTLSFDKNYEVNYTEYKYDNVGNKIEMLTANGAQSTKYEYDNLNRMTKLIYPSFNGTTPEDDRDLIEFEIRHYVVEDANLTNPVRILDNANPKPIDRDFGYVGDSVDRNIYKYGDYTYILVNPEPFILQPGENILVLYYIRGFSWMPVSAEYYEDSGEGEQSDKNFVSTNDNNNDIVRPYMVFNMVQSDTQSSVGLQSTVGLNELPSECEIYEYDKNGNLISKTDRNGNVTINNYDALNRLIEVSVTTPSGKAIEFMKYTYAKTGAKIKEENENLITEYVNDSLGRLDTQTETNKNDSTVVVKKYTYDALDNRKTFVLMQNEETKTNQSYDYDNMNRLWKTYENGSVTPSATYTYDANGNRASLTYSNGVTAEYFYNKSNLVTSLVNKKGVNTLSGFSYTYYLDGNQASKSDSTGRNTTYEYDGLSRLKNETEKLNNTLVFSKTYTYDKANNRKTMVVSGEENYTTSYTYDSNNRLKTETKEKDFTTETAEYQYDNNGNQISKMTYSVGNGTGSGEIGIYVLGLHRPTPRENYTVELNEYDVFNRLVGVQNDEGTSIYTYKPDGLRAGTTKKGIMGSTGSEDVTTTYIWDGGYAQTPKMGGMVSAEIVMELDSNGNVIDRYIYGIGRIKSDIHGFYLYNAHGDVVQLTNASGVVTKNYQYDAFGVEINKDDADNNPFRYCAEYYDKETDTIYLRNRYYNPAVGGFMSEDPTRDGLNWYTYCTGNPIMFIDPTGLVGQSIIDYHYGLGYTGVLENKDDYAIFFKTDKKGNKTYKYWTNGKSVTFPNTVTGTMNGSAVSFNPNIDWGGAGKGNYPAGEQKDSDGRYMVAVGPKVLNPNYSKDGKIWDSEFASLNSNILVVLKHKTTGEIKIIECTVTDIKAHSYNKYPDGHANSSLGSASFSVDNGLVQTGISYPNSSNAGKSDALAPSHSGGISVIEFAGHVMDDFTIRDYKLLEVVNFN